MNEVVLQLVVSATGRVELATRGGHEWLDIERARRLSDIVQTAERDEISEALYIIDGVRVRFVRVYGTSVAYIATFASASEGALLSSLTPRQREVAEYAVAGATAREIAKALDIKFNTARDHLKEVYRRLGVSSRAELVTAVGFEKRSS